MTQIVAKGVVSAEEINQIAERLPQIRTLMKEAFGTSDTEVLQKMGIGSDEFIAAIVDAASELERATMTSSAAMSNLQDDWKDFMQSIGDLVEPGMTPLFASLSSLLEQSKSTVLSVRSTLEGGFFGMLGFNTNAEARDYLVRGKDRSISEEGAAEEPPKPPSQVAEEKRAEDKQQEELAKFDRAEAEANGDAEKRRLARAAEKQREQEREAERRASERERLTESVASLSFAAASPEMQMQILRDRIEASLGVSGSREEIIAAANDAANEGWLEKAEVGLSSLAQIEAIAGRQPAGSSTGSAQGSFATLMDQIFGRGTPEQQLDETRRTNQLAEDHLRKLDEVLKKMDEPPPKDVFSDFGV
jgi:hypothetical protein